MIDYFIRTLSPDVASAIDEAAHILTAAFAESWPGAWSTHDAARTEVYEALAPDHICRAAFDADGRVLGWIGGVAQYHGHVWELHPLAVRPDVQGRGIGRVLVTDFEQQVAQRGGVTILLGADDEAGMTTLVYAICAATRIRFIKSAASSSSASCPTPTVWAVQIF
jgi:aminoglycoside 6'-N-acetyltransferase I